MRSWDESSGGGGKETKLGFKHKIKPFQNKILQIFWTDTQFHEMAPNFAHFTATLKLDMKQGLEGQTRAQRQGDSMDNFILLELHNFSTTMFCRERR